VDYLRGILAVDAAPIQMKANATLPARSKYLLYL
jgi:hypothetical protein